MFVNQIQAQIGVDGSESEMAKYQVNIATSKYITRAFLTSLYESTMTIPKVPQKYWVVCQKRAGINKYQK